MSDDNCYYSPHIHLFFLSLSQITNPKNIIIYEKTTTIITHAAGIADRDAGRQPEQVGGETEERCLNCFLLERQTQRHV